MSKPLFKMALVLALLAALPALAADRVITNGIDLFQTRPDGSSFADFRSNPIPAGFFCAGSAPFTGRIAWRGVPFATGTPGALGATDTIVQRLDDATFNSRGVAWTRVQMRALSMESVQPIRTSCGLFTAKASLQGEQPITRMRIVRENAKGGRFEAPLAVNARITFTPVGRPAAEPLELTQKIRFAPVPNQRWDAQPGPGGLQKRGFVLVDTDGDRNPDTYLPGTSNFAVGLSGGLNKAGGCHLSEMPQFMESEHGHCV